MQPDAQVERDGSQSTTPPVITSPDPNATATQLTPPAGEPEEQTPEVVETECEDKTNPECLTDEELEEREARAAETAEERLDEEPEETAAVDPEVQKRQILSDFIQSVYSRGNLVDEKVPSLQSDAGFRVLSQARLRSMRLKNQSLNSYCFRDLCPLISPITQRSPASGSHNIVLPPELSVRFTHKDLWQQIFIDRDGEDVARPGRHFISLGNSIVGVIVQGSDKREAKIIVDEQLIGYQIAMGYDGVNHHLVVVSDYIRAFEVFEQVENNSFQRYTLTEPNNYSKVGSLTVSYGKVDDVDFVNSVPMGLWDSDLQLYKVQAEQTRIAAVVAEVVAEEGGAAQDREVVSEEDRGSAAPIVENDDAPIEDNQVTDQPRTEADPDLIEQEVPTAAVDTSQGDTEPSDPFGRFFVSDFDIKQIQCVPAIVDEESGEYSTIKTVLNFFPKEGFRYPEFDKLDGAEVEDLQNELPFAKFPDGTPMSPVLDNGTLKLVSHDENSTLLEILDQTESKQGELKFEKREDNHYVGIKKEGDETYSDLLVCVSYNSSIKAGYIQHPEVPGDQSWDFVIRHQVRYEHLTTMDIFALFVDLRVKTSANDPYSVKDGQVYHDGNPVDLASGNEISKEKWEMEIDATGIPKIILPDGEEEAPNGGKIQVLRPVYSEDENDNNIVFTLEVLSDSENTGNLQRIVEGLDLDNREEALHLAISEGTNLCVNKTYTQLQAGLDRRIGRREVLGTCFGQLKITLPKDSPIEIWRGDRQLFEPVEINQE